MFCFCQKKKQKKKQKNPKNYVFWIPSTIPESPGHAPLAIQKDNKRLVTTLKVRVRGEAHDEVHLKCL